MSEISKKKRKQDLQMDGNADDKKHHNDKTDDFEDWKRLEKWQIGRRKFC
jgi:hypothetical protein